MTGAGRPLTLTINLNLHANSIYLVRKPRSRQEPLYLLPSNPDFHPCLLRHEAQSNKTCARCQAPVSSNSRERPRQRFSEAVRRHSRLKSISDNVGRSAVNNALISGRRAGAYSQEFRVLQAFTSAQATSRKAPEAQLIKSCITFQKSAQ